MAVLLVFRGGGAAGGGHRGGTVGRILLCLGGAYLYHSQEGSGQGCLWVWQGPRAQKYIRNELNIKINICNL